MPVLEQSGNDALDFSEAMAEVSQSFEVPVIIRRWSSETGRDESSGTGGIANFTNISTRANISDMTAKQVIFPGSIYAIGDLHAEFRVPVYGMETHGGDSRTGAVDQSDHIIYRNREYVIIGHVMTPEFNGVRYWKAALREVGRQ
jgi:hypothetical protein